MISDRALLNWLMLLAIAHIAGGLALPLLILQTHWLDAALPAPLLEMRPMLALFGPTVASWGVLLAFLVRHAMRERQRWACDALILAIVVWMPLDAALCVWLGYGQAVIVDLVAAPALLVPAFMLRSRFARG
jgi:hypothetical protein